MKSKYLFIPFFVLILLNIYWILGLFKIGALQSNALFERSLFGNNYWNIVHSLSLHFPWWTSTGVTVFKNQPIPAYFWFIPIFVLLGLILNKKNRIVVGFAAVALFGILLSKQVGQPFSNLYLWLFNNMPGFKAYRVATPFYSLIAIGYSMLLSAFTAYIWSKNDRTKLVSKYILTSLILFLFLWNLKPLITGDIGTMFIPRQIPSDYKVFEKFVQLQDANFRTLWVPRYSQWASNTTNNSKISTYDLVTSTWLNILPPIDEFNVQSIESQVTSVVDFSFSQNLLSLTIFKYVVVPIEDVANDDNFFIDFGLKNNINIRQWYIDKLDSIPWLIKIEIGTKDLVVYENKNYEQLIHSFTQLYALNTANDLDQKYSFISNKFGGQFYFASKNLSAPTSNFAQAIQVTRPFENINEENFDSFLHTVTATTSVSTLATNVYTQSGRVASSSVASSGASEELYVFTEDHKAKHINKKTVEFQPSIDSAASYRWEYTNPNYSFLNLIPNPSFEAGLWRDSVGDCNNYDDNGLIKMILNGKEKTDGAQSLQLEATRHMACTGVTVPVKGGSVYVFSFSYQGSREAGYHLGLDSATSSSLSERLPAKKDWKQFTRTIRVPEDASKLAITMYAYESDGVTNNINRYDNFKLIEIPDIADTYYMVSDPELGLQEPQSITFDLLNPTKKLVHIKGATTPFYLAFSESFHPQWKLEMNNAKVQGKLSSWWPWARPDSVADEYHYSLNTFLNAWYVDTKELCEVQKLEGCIKNGDGSYDIEMVIEFWPQRWFYVGLIISGTTLLACLGYLGYTGVRSLRGRRESLQMGINDIKV